ncbi:hypothetical protein HK107_10330 [Parvularcula sp. ZS-1/3]|uniref:NADH:ubiquinone oxidoreductase intermediate-associated protein 30 domain-containing protein n=1 Tax=Parvularcula mediterranea TaxID=2732508 RepID=A0A7Y3W5P7_9PROT|nr:CIA30 family protein [Parvularcula mediterranea]NNU16718.1 hypothetical protein [Parvularcula mediterranea]
MLIAALIAGLAMTECTTIDDFSGDEFGRWRTVNDGVMGGRSDGSARVKDGVMVFEGNINTNGGGFSSVRRGLQGMEGATHIEALVEGDGRAYELIFQTNERYRGRRVTYRAALTSETHDEPQTVRAELSDMPTTIFGRSVRAADFDASDAVEIGIILADGEDGPFELKVHKISYCR